MPRQNVTHQDGPGHVIHAADVDDPDLYLANLSRGVYTAAEYGAVGDGTTDDSAKLAATDAAAAYGCGFFSLPAKWGQLAVTNGMIGSTNNHPTPAGHQDIATTLLAIL